jgi:hypothetical protein
MDSKQFRARATYAIDLVARFIDEFPELYCVMRIGDQSSNMDVIIGTVERKQDVTEED